MEVADRNKIIGESRAERRGENSNPEAGPEGGGVLGLAVKNLTPDQAQELTTQLHLEAKQGVLVTDVQGDVALLPIWAWSAAT